jgi:hypothetical protein
MKHVRERNLITAREENQRWKNARLGKNSQETILEYDDRYDDADDETDIGSIRPVSPMKNEVCPSFPLPLSVCPSDAETAPSAPTATVDEARPGHGNRHRDEEIEQQYLQL